MEYKYKFTQKQSTLTFMKKYKGYVRHLLLLTGHEVNIIVLKSIQPLYTHLRYTEFYKVLEIALILNSRTMFTFLY